MRFEIDEEKGTAMIAGYPCSQEFLDKRHYLEANGYNSNGSRTFYGTSYMEEFYYKIKHKEVRGTETEGVA